MQKCGTVAFKMSRKAVGGVCLWEAQMRERCFGSILRVKLGLKHTGDHCAEVITNHVQVHAKWNAFEDISRTLELFCELVNFNVLILLVDKIFELVDTIVDSLLSKHLGFIEAVGAKGLLDLL